MIKLLCTHTIGVYFLWEGAAATYLKSLCDASTRAKKGKQEAHRNLCRKQGRMREVGCHNVLYIDIYKIVTRTLRSIKVHRARRINKDSQSKPHSKH